MSRPSIQLKIPEEISERAREIASESQRSVESVLIDGLALLFGISLERDMSPDALKSFSDEQLWAVVHRRLAWPQHARLRELVILGEEQRLSADEQAEMEDLIGTVDHQMLLRSEALLLLKRRGHNIEKHLKLGA